jgi:hypothetical protein
VNVDTVPETKFVTNANLVAAGGGDMTDVPLPPQLASSIAARRTAKRDAVLRTDIIVLMK